MRRGGLGRTAFAASVAGPALVVLLAAPEAAVAWDASFCTTDPLPFCGTATEVDGLGLGPNAFPFCPSAPRVLDPSLGELASTTPFDHLPTGGTAPISRGEARRALAEARRLAVEGRAQEALLHLRVLEEAYPHLADRFGLVRGMLLLAAGAGTAACDALFDAADRTVDPTVKARARIAFVECRLRTGHEDAERSLRTLTWRYPELPDALRLELLQAQMHEAEEATQAAIDAYRLIDYRHPGSPEAAIARDRLAAIAESGVELREMPLTVRVTRTERLVAEGPLDLAREEVEALLTGPRLRPDLESRVALLAARLAQAEGRWEEAAAHAERARAGAPGDGADDGEDGDEATQRFLEKLDELRSAAIARDETIARNRLDYLRGRGDIDDLPIPRLRAMVEVASRVGFREDLDDALRALTGKRNLSPEARFQAAILSAGIGDDDARARLLEPILGHRRLGLAARYHRARALEGMGAFERAKIAYEDVIRRDEESTTPFYGLWAAQRLRVVEEGRACRCTPRPLAERLGGMGPPVGPPLPGEERPLRLAAPGMPFGFGEAPPERVRRKLPEPVDTDELIDRLDVLARDHGAAFPWLARARDLLGLGEVLAARDELHEAYLAWRQAVGRPLERVGVETVYRGAALRSRIPAPYPAHDQRKGLPEAARLELAEIAAALGDEGVAVGLAGWERAEAHPRAYEDLVQGAAARHGIDPNLLLAVMRVESIYQERIVSYAGAIGLMQIMPRTGRLIADRLGLDDFVVSDLLDPATNVELGAWYLASLLDRFDGRLPLAIAAYNGGPHNVRRWMVDYGDDLAVDAFLERIPFSQTHRYVRRVLSHYATYRAQAGLDLPPLHLSLPSLETDDIAF
jgi:soluble lytic murein transglycosylase